MLPQHSNVLCDRDNVCDRDIYISALTQGLIHHKNSVSIWPTNETIYTKYKQIEVEFS